MKFPTIYDYQHLPSPTATVRALLLLIFFFASCTRCAYNISVLSESRAVRCGRGRRG